ncbi:MAG: hypothetical protein HYY16_05685 [Planctomycetes bacterium]|nr:hypothetical protein [Planctomycetota bacterium]
MEGSDAISAELRKELEALLTDDLVRVIVGAVPTAGREGEGGRCGWAARLLAGVVF